MIYIFLLLVLLFGCVYFNDNRRDSHNYYLFFEYIIIVLIFGLRYKVGGDTLNYFYAFTNWPTLDEISNYEPKSSKYNIGWMYLSALCKQIYNDFFILQIVQSAFINAAIFYFFKKHLKNYFTAIFLYGLMYLFTYNTEIMRAAIVVGIFLFGYDSLVKKNWLVYYTLCIIAYLFHSEAVVMLILPICIPLSKIKPDVINLTFFIVGCILMVILFNVVPLLLSLFSGFERIMSVFLIYSDKTFESNFNGYIAHLFFTIPWLFFLWITKDEKFVVWRGFLLLYILFTFLQLRYTLFMIRACDCLYPFTIVAIADAIQRRKYIHDKLIRLFIPIFILIVVSNRTYNLLKDDHWKLFYPYSSVIEPEENFERYELLKKFQNDFE